MSKFINFVTFEFKQFFNTRNMVIVILFFLAAMFFVFDGSSQYKEIMEKKDDFVKMEKLRVERNNSYSQYGASGFRVLYIPAKLSIFFYNSGISSDLEADIDVGTRLNIVSSFKGKDAFKDRPGSYGDFSGLLIFIGPLLILLYGFEPFRQGEYLKYLSSLTRSKGVSWYILSARFVVVTALLLLLFGAAVLAVLLNGVSLSSGDVGGLSVFFGVCVLFVLFFLMVGGITGLASSKTLGLAIVGLLWIAFVYFAPLGLQKITSLSARDMPKNHKVELEKFDILMGFEKRAIKEVGKYTKKKGKTKDGKALIKSYVKNEFTKLHNMAVNLKMSMDFKACLIENLAVFTPCTFLSSLSDGISSKGINSNIDFFMYTIKLKDNFGKFYIHKKFYSNDKKVVSFIKNDENIYYAKSLLPANFAGGLAIMSIYIIILAAVFYFISRRVILRISDEELEHIGKAELETKKGEYIVGTIYSDGVPNLLFRLCSGDYNGVKKRGFKGSVKVDGNDIASIAPTEDFLFVCRPGGLPVSASVRDFVCFSAGAAGIKGSAKKDILENPSIKGMSGKKIGSLGRYEKCDVLLALTGAIKRDIYLIHDIAPGMSDEFAIRFKEHMEQLSGDGAAVVYMTSDDKINTTPQYITPLFKNKHWSGEVEARKDANNKRKDKNN